MQEGQMSSSQWPPQTQNTVQPSPGLLYDKQRKELILQDGFKAIQT